MDGLSEGYRDDYSGPAKCNEAREPAMRKKFHLVEWRNAQGFPTGQWSVCRRTGQAVGGPFSEAEALRYIQALKKGMRGNNAAVGDSSSVRTKVGDSGV